MASGKFLLRAVLFAVLLTLLPTGGDSWHRRRRRRSCSCDWNGWSAYSGCSAACGGGTQHRTRTRNSCCSPSQETQTVACNTHSCCSCTWSPWSYWGSCSRTCGGGTMTRTRHRNSCCYPRTDSQTMSCNTQSCCSCEWSNWHAWSSCSQTCGEGRQTRSRYLDICCIPPYNHFQQEARSCHNHCDGHSHEHGVPGLNVWSAERLTLIILGVLLGIVISGVLVWYCCIRDPDRVYDIRGRY